MSKDTLRVIRKLRARLLGCDVKDLPPVPNKTLDQLLIEAKQLKKRMKASMK